MTEWSANEREVWIGACVPHERIQLGEVADPSNGMMPKVASLIAFQAMVKPSCMMAAPEICCWAILGLMATSASVNLW